MTGRLPEWNELMHRGRPLMPVERLLIQCIATISTHPRFEQMTPEQVYDEMRAQTAQILLENLLRKSAAIDNIAPADVKT
jgi:hypothetical protein